MPDICVHFLTRSVSENGHKRGFLTITLFSETRYTFLTLQNDSLVHLWQMFSQVRREIRVTSMSKCPICDFLDAKRQKTSFRADADFQGPNTPVWHWGIILWYICDKCSVKFAAKFGLHRCQKYQNVIFQWKKPVFGPIRASQGQYQDFDIGESFFGTFGTLFQWSSLRNSTSIMVKTSDFWFLGVFVGLKIRSRFLEILSGVQITCLIAQNHSLVHAWQMFSQLRFKFWPTSWPKVSSKVGRGRATQDLHTESTSGLYTDFPMPKLPA